MTNGKTSQPGQKAKPTLLTQAQFNIFLFVSQDRLIVNKLLTSRVSRAGILKNLIKIELTLNKHAQNLLGMQDYWYDLYVVSSTNVNKKNHVCV